MINGKTFTDLGYEGKQVGECLQALEDLKHLHDSMGYIMAGKSNEIPFWKQKKLDKSNAKI